MFTSSERRRRNSSQWPYEKLPRDELLPISTYNLPKELKQVLKNNSNKKNNDQFWTSFLKKISNLPDVETDYYETFKNLLYLEEFYNNETLESTSKAKTIRILFNEKQNNFKIMLNIEDDLCFLKKGSTFDVYKEGSIVKHPLKITEIHFDRIIVEAVYPVSFEKQYNSQEFYNIELEYSNWPNRVCHFALELLIDSISLDSCFIYEKRFSLKPEVEITNWFNKNIEKNEQQKQAVQRMVGRTSYPEPYLVFGPPGTGKTATIVEAICQINRRRDNVLICTPSNAAADEVTRRLLQNKIDDNEIYRMTSRSVDRRNIPEDIEICMNFEDGELDYYHSSEIYRSKKIVIATLVTSARFLRLHSFSRYFNYIFIDEAGQATQPETLIPIAISKNHSKCQIIMSGDPKQLGPVVMTKYGDHLLGKSMLERLMEKSELYKKGYNNKYDPNFLTKLVKNYRSHEAILKLPNFLFYENELIACAGNNVKIAENWTLLPRKKFPIIFHAVYGYEEINELHSVANEAEVKIVIKYIEKLIHDGLDGIKIEGKNIGVVTPFRWQKRKINEILNEKNFTDISVGTVENFQGQEKEIIIVSLVRSAIFVHEGRYHVGFLSNEKRFNVTITRAKSLLIVIGHPKVLQIDNCWKKFMMYCKENEACRGDNFHLNDVFSAIELKSLVNNRIEIVAEDEDKKRRGFTLGDFLRK
ncbi:putative helicase mov-10-B.1 [Leptopilina heterotoma]|uniref:putative helicase mov-10-B.1 n=1 Tax=Leptopilina heterotoma TaxID=63436 RepID=UPI001CA80218|nr:putative helicase mov-10-B.1 [Leptopilina heterotoma]